MMNRPTEPNRVRFDLRRSQRVRAQLPVVAQGKLTGKTPFVDPTRAIVLSAHGCLITLSASVRLGERIILRNSANREEQDCRVVYLGEKQGGRTEVGLRFKTAAPQFWGLEHPPPDWKLALTWVFSVHGQRLVCLHVKSSTGFQKILGRNRTLI